MKTYVVSALIIIMLISCTDRENQSTASKQKAPEFYRIADGRFRKVSGIENLSPRTFLPWTAQERVSDIAFDTDKILFAINRYGIAYLDLNMPQSVSFHYFFDSSLFSGKTLTTIIPYGDDACCHFYFNSSLGSEGQYSKTGKTVNFAFFPVRGVQDRFTPYTLPFQEKRDGYEAVGFLPVTKISWYIEWKKTGTETRFDYTAFDIGGRYETSISRAEFRNAFKFSDLGKDNITPELKNISREAIRRIGRNEAATTYHFLMKVKDTNLIERYSSTARIDPSDLSYEIVNVVMFRDERGMYALAGNDALLFIAYDTDVVLDMSLPKLPPSYTFTGLFIHENAIYLAWEESSFYKTGNAGLMIAQNAWN